MDYKHIFQAAIDRLHDEGRYRVFIDILRTRGRYPDAQCFGGNGPKRTLPLVAKYADEWNSTSMALDDYRETGLSPTVAAGDPAGGFSRAPSPNGTACASTSCPARPERPAELVRRLQRRAPRRGTR